MRADVLPEVAKMAIHGHRGYDPLRDTDITRRASNFRQFLTLAALAVVLVAWRFADDVLRGEWSASWTSVIVDCLTVIALFLIAAALIRMIDFLVVRRAIKDRAKRSHAVSEDIRQRLQGLEQKAASPGEKNILPPDHREMLARALRYGQRS
jgi:hypothetical protein